MRILLVNDDGIHAPGLAALKAEMSTMGTVTVSAPDVERSAAGHSITLDKPLRVREVYVGNEFLGYGVDGSPADCVKIGLSEILRGKPDLVLSGVNLGANVGINVLYSGTVAAALEGAILGLTSFAVSLAGSKKPDFAGAAKAASKVVRRLMQMDPPAGSLFNINVPACPPEEIKGVRFARQCTVSYDDGFIMRTDPRGGKYFWMTGELKRQCVEPDTDTALLDAGFVTVTPLQYDLTDRGLLEKAREWKMDV